MLSKLIASTLAISTLVCAQSAHAEYPVTVAPVVSQPVRGPRYRAAAIMLLASGSGTAAAGVALTVAAALQPFPRLAPCPPATACGPVPTPVGPYLYIAGGLALGLGVGAVITGAVLFARGNQPERQTAPLALRTFGVAPSTDGVAASALFTF